MYLLSWALSPCCFREKVHRLTVYTLFEGTSIEDTPELQVPHPNWIREVTREPKPGEEGSGVGMFLLLKAALRQRPNEILVGEIRGEEGLIAFSAMQTGHAVMATFHASTVEKLIQRLTGSPISVPKTYIDNLNVVVIQTAVTLPNGKTGRRAVSVNEIVGGIFKKCVNSQAVYLLSEQHGLEAQERR